MAGNRSRLLLSDGKSTITGMLATQLNGLVEDGSIIEFSIIRVVDFMTNSSGGST